MSRLSLHFTSLRRSGLAWWSRYSIGMPPRQLSGHLLTMRRRVLISWIAVNNDPFVLVKSYRKEERNGRPAVVPVQLGIDSYYKAYRAARPSEVSSEDAAVVRDPARFKSSRMRSMVICTRGCFSAGRAGCRLAARSGR